MKYIAIIIFICLSFFSFQSVNAQSPIIEWQRCYGGSDAEEAHDVHQTKDGGYLVTGFSASTDGDVVGNAAGQDGQYNYWILKLNSAGAIQWQSLLPAPFQGGPASSALTSDGGSVSVGTGGNSITGSYGLMAVRLDSAGVIKWQKIFTDSTDENFFGLAYSVSACKDGGFIMAGEKTDSLNFTVYNYWIIKTDSLGNMQWNKIYGGSQTDIAESVKQTPDNGFIVAGYTSSTDGDVTFNHGNEDYWILKLDSTGNLQWQKTYGGSDYEEAYSVELTSDSGYIIAGYTSSLDGDVTGNMGGGDVWIVKTDANGNIKWEKCYGGSGNDFAYHITHAADGGYLIAGVSQSTDGQVTGYHQDGYGGYDYWVLKIDSVGNLLWEKCLGGTNIDWGKSIQETSDGGCIVAGITSSSDGDITNYHGGQTDYWVVKLTAGLTGTPIIEQSGDVTVFPNPVHDVLTVQGPQNSSGTLMLMDIYGRTIYESNYTSNEPIQMETGGFPKGIYIVKLQEQNRYYVQSVVIQ